MDAYLYMIREVPLELANIIMNHICLQNVKKYLVGIFKDTFKDQTKIWIEKLAQSNHILSGPLVLLSLLNYTHNDNDVSIIIRNSESLYNHDISESLYNHDIYACTLYNCITCNTIKEYTVINRFNFFGVNDMMPSKRSDIYPHTSPIDIEITKPYAKKYIMDGFDLNENQLKFTFDELLYDEIYDLLEKKIVISKIKFIKSAIYPRIIDVKFDFTKEIINDIIIEKESTKTSFEWIDKVIAKMDMNVIQFGNIEYKFAIIDNCEKFLLRTKYPILELHNRLLYCRYQNPIHVFDTNVDEQMIKDYLKQQMKKYFILHCNADPNITYKGIIDKQINFYVKSFIKVIDMIKKYVRLGFIIV